MENHYRTLTIETRFAECGSQYAFQSNAGLHAHLGTVIEHILPGLTIFHEGVIPRFPDSTHIGEVRVLQLIVPWAKNAADPELVTLVETVTTWLEGRIRIRRSQGHRSYEAFFIIISGADDLLCLINQAEVDTEARVEMIAV